MSVITKFEDDATEDPIERENKMVSVVVHNVETSETIQSHLSAESYAALISGEFDTDEFKVSRVFLHD